jgi:hypothetical protein
MPLLYGTRFFRPASAGSVPHVRWRWGASRRWFGRVWRVPDAGVGTRAVVGHAAGVCIGTEAPCAVILAHAGISATLSARSAHGAAHQVSGSNDAKPFGHEFVSPTRTVGFGTHLALHCRPMGAWKSTGSPLTHACGYGDGWDPRSWRPDASRRRLPPLKDELNADAMGLAAQFLRSVEQPGGRLVERYR